jgi:hypothetical protein
VERHCANVVLAAVLAAVMVIAKPSQKRVYKGRVT